MALILAQVFIFGLIMLQIAGASKRLGGKLLEHAAVLTVNFVGSL